MLIWLAHENAVFRTGLKGFLAQLAPRPNCQEFADFESLKDRLLKGDEAPSAILISSALAGYSNSRSVDTLKKLLDRSIRLIVLGDDGERCRELGVQAIQHGAQAYVLETLDADRILQAVQQALTGEIVIMCEPETQRVDTTANQRALGGHNGGAHSFTERQADVLRLLGEGMSNAEIASKLNLSTHTVRLHVSAILRTIGASNRTQAALFARDWFG